MKLKKYERFQSVNQMIVMLEKLKTDRLKTLKKIQDDLKGVEITLNSLKNREEVQE